MSTHVTRRAVIAAAAAAAIPGAAPGQTPPRPLLLPNKTSLFRRIITHPGAMLSQQPDAQGAKPIPGFEVFYVYPPDGGTNGWIQVGRASDGQVDGWIEAAKTIEWRHTLIGAFTNPTGRQRALFLDTKEAERDLLLDPDAGAAAQRMLAEAEAHKPTHVKAAEPPAWANIDERFYLLPILSATAIEREFPPAVRLLEVISVPDKPPQDKKPFKAAVVFLIDTTVSMQPYIDATRNVLRRIVAKVRESEMRDSFRFGLVAYRDSLEDRPGLEYAAKVYAKPDFSQPADQIMSAIAEVRQAKVSSAGFIEDPIGGLKTTFDEIDWPSFSEGFRHVLLITDAGARAADHPHSVTHLGIPEIKALGDQKGISISVFHLLTEAGAQANDHEPARKQYVELTKLNAQADRYYAVPPAESPSRFVTPGEYEIQGDHYAQRLLTAAAKITGQLPPALEAPRGPAARRMTEQFPILEEAMRLAYLGQTTQATVQEQLVHTWTTDRDLKTPALTSIGIRVLLTKNQLSDLANSLKGVLQGGRAGQLEPQNFFTLVQTAVAASVNDPQRIARINRATQVGGLLGEYLDDLPYKSTLLNMDSTEWMQMSAQKQGDVINRIENLLALYGQYNASGNWYDLGHSGKAGEKVYPVPIEYLP